MPFLELLEETDKIEDFIQLVDAFESTVQDVSTDDANRPIYLDNLAAARQMEFERTRSVDSLNFAIACSEEAVDCAEVHQNRPLFLNNLGIALRLRFEELEEEEDIHRAIQCHEAAVLQNPNQGSLFRQLGVALTRRFEVMGPAYIEDMNQAIAAFRKGLEVAAVTGDERVEIELLENLAAALVIRAERTGSTHDLDEAIVSSRHAATKTPADHPDRWSRLHTMANVLSSRYSLTSHGSNDDLNDAINAGEQASNVTQNDRDRAMTLDQLGYLRWLRYERLGLLDDLELSIAYSREALALTPPDHPYRAGYLCNLAKTLLSRFQRKGDGTDLDNSIMLLDDAIKSTPDRSPDLPTMVNNLGDALRTRYEFNGSRVDLDRAVQECEKASDLTPIGHADRPGHLNNLGLALQCRFELDGSMADSARAIAAYQDAIKSTVEGPGAVLCFSNLGNALHGQVHRTNSTENVEQAIGCYENALKLMPPDHPDRARILNCLGHALQTSFTQTHSALLLEKAIMSHKEALKLVPLEHIYRASCLISMCAGLYKLFGENNDFVVLEEAIAYGEQALQLLREDDPLNSTVSLNLGILFQVRFRHTRSERDFRRAMKCLDKAVRFPLAPPTTRIKAAQRALYIFLSEDDMDVDLCSFRDILKIAVELLPSTAPHTVSRDDRQYNLSFASGLATVAAALTVKSGGNAFEAVRLLEVGRGVMASRQLETRGDITLLEQLDPTLATKFKMLRDELDWPRWDEDDVAACSKSSRTASSRLHSAAREWAPTIDTIRHGWRDFSLDRHCTTLCLWRLKDQLLFSTFVISVVTRSSSKNQAFVLFHFRCSSILI